MNVLTGYIFKMITTYGVLKTVSTIFFDSFCHCFYQPSFHPWGFTWFFADHSQDCGNFFAGEPSVSIFSQVHFEEIHQRKNWRKLKIHPRKDWRNHRIYLRKTMWIPILLPRNLQKVQTYENDEIWGSQTVWVVRFLWNNDLCNLIQNLRNFYSFIFF